MKKVRRVNIELLRIICMIMIGILHASGHGGIIGSYEFNETGYVVWALIKMFCMVSVNCFVLITGYFMVDSKIRFSKIAKYILQIIFFSILCTFGAHVILGKDISLEELWYSIFPLTSNCYWFATAYVILMLFIPILNKLVQTMEKEELKKIIILLIIVFSVVPNIFVWSYKILGKGSNFSWLCVVYLVGAYLRVYGVNISKKKSFILYITLCILGGVSKIAITILTVKLLGSPYGTDIFYSNNSMIVFPASICFFICFCQIKVKSKVLTYVSKLGIFCFGAYLISDHNIIRDVLWEKVNLAVLVEYGHFVTVGGVLGVSVIILLVGCFVEWLRLEILNLTGIDRRIKNLDVKVENSKIVSKILD